jgi:SAM-dependent methyltransferase
MRKPPAAALKERLPRLTELWRAAAPNGRSELATVGRDLLRLQRGLTGDRRLAGAGYMDDPDLLAAYLLYYWPVSYLQVSLALAVLEEDGLATGARILDLGAGPGPAAAAILDSCANPEAGLDLVLADSSDKALSLARAILGRDRDKGRLRGLETLRVDLESPAALQPLAAQGPFDLIVMGHCLNELWRASEDGEAQRLDLLLRVSGLLSPGGRLLLVEPSLLLTSRGLLGLRDALAARGFPVLGPCLRQGPCPALAAGPNHTCHMEAAWEPPEPVASLAKAAGLDRDSVKMTWVAFGKPQPGTEPAPFIDSPLHQAVKEALVVSEAMLNKAGRLRWLLCDESGRFAFSARKDDAAARASGFFGLRRGDRIAVEGAEIRGAEGSPALGFLPSTRLAILRPAPSIAGEGKAKP